MIKIAIVEDEVSCREQLQEFLVQLENKIGEKFEVTVFTDGDEIVEGYKVNFDIILLDIQMRFMDGMTAAEEIRKVDPEVVIIFITNLAQYAIHGYKVDALDFILKPISFFAFSQRLERAIARMKNRAGNYIIVNIKGGIQKLDIEKIYYIETQGHYLIFHTRNGEYTVSGTLQEIEKTLEKHRYYRINRFYLVNLGFVDGIKGNFAIVNGTPLLISRARKNSFLNALNNYFSETIK